VGRAGDAPACNTSWILVDGPKGARYSRADLECCGLVVDPKSALFVSGSVLDYSEDLQKGGFK